MGGDCLNTGCVPSKALLSSARLAAQIRRAPEWGLEPLEPRLRPPARAREHARAPGADRSARLAGAVRGPRRRRRPRPGALPLAPRGPGRRPAPSRPQLRDRDGSRAAIPPIEGLAEAAPYTNETIFDELREAPARMIVLGGGPIGCELGQAFARLGVKVTIVEVAAPHPREGGRGRGGGRAPPAGGRRRARDRRAPARAGSPASGGRARAGAPGRPGPPGSAGGGGPARGRRPRAEHRGSGPRRGRRRPRREGHHASTRACGPRSAHIYAAGDVAGGHQFTHVADDHARTIVRNILLPWPAKRSTTRCCRGAPTRRPRWPGSG